MTAAAQARRAAAARLADSGVASPDHDAAELLALVLGRTRKQIPVLGELSPAQLDEYDALVARRAAREPLQHLTGRAAFRHVEVAVGPGVFVPRPETELLAGWVIDAARMLQAPVVVDLCTGSGAIARSVADEVPAARVHAVELDPAAHRWAEQNLAGTGIDLRLGDMATACADLNGRVDVVVCNPPYIPMEAWASVAPEARDHDPALALWSGQDGLAAMRVLEEAAARLLRPGGRVAAEHADAQGSQAPEVFVRASRWTEITDHPDLAGRDRFVTARLAR